MGDSIIGLASCQYLKEIYPNSKLTYAIPKWIEPLFSDTEASYDHLYGFELGKISDYFQFYKFLKKQKFDLIFELFQSGRTSRFLSFYSLSSKTPYFFHNHHQKKTSAVVDQAVNKAIIQKDLDGIYSQITKEEKAPDFLKYCPRLALTQRNCPKENLITFGVVGSKETKMWPLKNWQMLAQKLHQLNNCKIQIPISDRKSDHNIKLFFKTLDLDFVEVVTHSLKDLPYTLAKSNLYIGNDTGIKHLCIALGVKTITLFGPEQPCEWHPYDKLKHPYLFINDQEMECRIESQHFCSLTTCEHHSCMKKISVEEVLSLV